MIASVVVVAKSWVLLSIVLLNSICQPFRPSDLQGGEIFIMLQFSFHSYLRGWVLDFGIHTIPFNIRFQMPVSISELYFFLIKYNLSVHEVANFCFITSVKYNTVNLGYKNTGYKNFYL